MKNTPLFALTHDAIDVDALKAQLSQASCGALVSFEGLVRNHNNQKPVTHLSYSAYEGMAVKVGTQIVQNALAEFNITTAVCVHRIGELAIGDMAIYVGVGASHRDEAFLACRHILDTVKADVPIWKQEFYADDNTPAWLSNNG